VVEDKEMKKTRRIRKGRECVESRRIRSKNRRKRRRKRD
jgi:hypothetical protein